VSVADALFEVLPSRLPGVKYFVRHAHVDERGSFRRIFSQKEHATVGIDDNFVEDNASTSARGVLRGMHFDFRLAKLVSVVYGEIYDVLVDVRRGEPTFGEWEGFALSASGCQQLYVPRGFAHGFYVLSDTAVVSYRQTDFYDAAFDGALRWDDPDVAIAWPLQGEPIVSLRDSDAPRLADVPPWPNA
jgi:dTDP-4-dehydrorhamnose 3,5-epimerase